MLWWMTFWKEIAKYKKFSDLKESRDREMSKERNEEARVMKRI